MLKKQKAHPLRCFSFQIKVRCAGAFVWLSLCSHTEVWVSTFCVALCAILNFRINPNIGRFASANTEGAEARRGKRCIVLFHSRRGNSLTPLPLLSNRNPLPLGFRFVIWVFLWGYLINFLKKLCRACAPPRSLRSPTDVCITLCAKRYMLYQRFGQTQYLTENKPVTSYSLFPASERALLAPFLSRYKNCRLRRCSSFSQKGTLRYHLFAIVPLL